MPYSRSRTALASIVALAALAALAAAIVVPPVHASAALHAPRVAGKHGTSTNWSGYAVQTNLSQPQSNAVSDVVGTWTVPGVSASAANAYSSNWVGIDGYSDDTVEQLGTEQDWYNGAPRYYAWWEMYPKASKLIPGMTVRAGDVVSAEVKYVGNRNFTLTMKDVTTGQTFSTTQRASAQRSSAEWIVEAPSSGGILPLANFGSTSFTGCNAVLNGHLGSISDPSRQYDPITMTTNGGTPLSVPSALSAGGTAFTMTRQ